jgi:hypothetical protein
MVAGMLATGRLRREYQGVYAAGHTATIPLGRETAAVLACGPRGVISGRSAAAIWGLGRPGGDGEAVELTILNGRASSA